jgi:fumarylpyruvate hydrolase
LQPGDLIYTGTPDGVGPLQRGDHITAGIEGLEDLEFRIA